MLLSTLSGGDLDGGRLRQDGSRGVRLDGASQLSLVEKIEAGQVKVVKLKEALQRLAAEKGRARTAA